MTAASSESTLAPDKRRRVRAGALATIASLAALAFRFWYASFRPLVHDEAYYWVWSRHLAGGYYDHPPAIAWLIWLSARLFGTSEFGVRALGVLLMAGTVAVVIRIAAEIGVDRRGRLLLLAVWLTSPLLAGLATVMTPDTSVAFFATLALLLGVRAARKLERGEPVRWEWLTLGAAGGMAMLSKYMAVLTAVAIGAAFLTHPRGRRALLTPGPYVAALVAVVVFYPVVHWNMRHGWESFRFQLSHGLDSDEEKPANALVGVLRFFGGQALMFTPVLFAIGVAAVAVGWAAYRRLLFPERILLWATTLPLAFFAYASTRTHGEENWPDLAYFPMSVLLVRHVSLAWERRLPLARVGCGVALAAAAVLQFPELLRPLPVKIPVALRDLFGWPALGEVIGRARDGTTPDLIMADKMQDAAEIEFYLPGRPPVWHYYQPTDRKKSAYLFFADRPDPKDARRVLFVGNDWSQFCAEYGMERVDHGYWVYHYGGRTPDRSRMWSLLVRNAGP